MTTTFVKKLVKKISLPAILIVMAFAACSTDMGVRQEFDKSVNQYNKYLSSQSFDAAGLFAAESLAKEFSARVKAAKNIKVVDYRIVRAKYDEEKGKAEVEVEIDYYNLSTYKLKTLIDIQKWAYTDENGAKQWRLMSLLPEFP